MSLALPAPPKAQAAALSVLLAAWAQVTTFNLNFSIFNFNISHIILIVRRTL